MDVNVNFGTFYPQSAYSFYVSKSAKESAAIDKKFKMDQNAKDELDKGIILETKTGSYFVLPLRTALESKTIKYLREDVGDDKFIPLSLDELTLLKTIELLMLQDRQFETKLKKLDIEDFINVFLAANYLNIPKLFDVMIEIYVELCFDKHVQGRWWTSENRMIEVVERGKYFDYKRKFIDILPKDLVRIIIPRWAAQEMKMDNPVEGYFLSDDKQTLISKRTHPLRTYFPLQLEEMDVGTAQIITVCYKKDIQDDTSSSFPIFLQQELELNPNAYRFVFGAPNSQLNSLCTIL